MSRKYPYYCELCDGEILILDDEDFHGVGNCVEQCEDCNGEGCEECDKKGYLLPPDSH